MVILKSVGDLGSNFNYKFQNLGSASGVNGRLQKKIWCLDEGVVEKKLL